jgi:DHA2 family multidrug resistance protein
LSFIFIPVSVMALSDLGPTQRGNATGLFNLTRELGGSIGTAWMGVVVTDGLKLHGSTLGSHLTAFDPTVQTELATLAGNVGTRTFAGQLVPEALLQLRVSGQALVLSFEDGFRLAGLAILLGLVAIVLMKRAQPGAAVSGAH